MKPYPYGISSLDLPDLELPPDPENCEIEIDVEIGRAPKEGGDIGFANATDRYVFTICTLKAVEDYIRTIGYFAVPNPIVLEKFSWESARLALEKLCDSIEEDSWDDISAQLAQYGRWGDSHV